MKTKIAILYTTFLRDELMYKTIQSILNNWKHYYTIFIADQGYQTAEKEKFYQSLPKEQVRQWYLPINCGLSYARNFLVAKAMERGFPYCLLSADSLYFTNKYYLDPYLEFLEQNKSAGIIGFDIENRVSWEYYLEKTNSFNLIKSNDFINYNYLRLKQVDICRNFFLAKTKVLYENKWNENLKMAEHEDWAWRLKTKTSYKIYYSNLICSRYIRDDNEEYLKMRKNNFREYRKLAMNIWNLNELFRVKEK